MSMQAKTAQRPAPTSDVLPRNGLLQRKCACGKSMGPSGECAECRRKRLGAQAKLRVSQPGDRWEQEADRAARQVLSPASHAQPPSLSPVQASAQRLSQGREDDDEKTKGMIQSKEASASGASAPETVAMPALGSGAPLSPELRRRFEPRFGHDFGQVRVHTDARAHAASRNLNARAFTLGQHIVFGAGEQGNQRLIAHELAHTVQQGKGGGPALQKEDLQTPLPDAPTTTPQEWTEENSPVAAEEGTTVAPDACVPTTALTWANFTGTPPANDYAAETAYTIKPTTVNTTRLFQAVFDGSKSWVREKYSKPSDRAKTGGDTMIAACEKFFASKGGEAGWTYGSDGAPDKKCAASPVMSASVEATKKEECTSVLGPEHDRVAALESARLLAHEQLHFAIACVFAKKANAALAAGKKESDVESAVQKKEKETTKAYDDESKHGCDAAKQATWVTDVGSNLPKVTL